MSGAQHQSQIFYRPYDSEDESGADSETASTDTWSETGEDQSGPPIGTTDGIPNFQAFATQMQLIDAAGRSFSTVRDELDYGVDRLGKYTVYGAYDAPPPDLSGEDTYGLTRFTTQDGNLASIIMLDSRYRDREAYPQPTNCTLRLPRIYKNITSIQFSEMKLLTSFYFFRLTKGNTDIVINEKDRSTFTYSNTWVPCIPRYFIREGSYNIDGLQEELQTVLNYTPLFYDYVNGFNDFVPLFRASGDFFLNFNQPGDNFYNNTTNQYIYNPTINTIVSQFWKTRYAGLTYYTNQQLELAYYYPVLKEVLQDEEYPDFIDLSYGLGIDPQITTEEQVRAQILYFFTGLTPVDQVVLAVIDGNLAKLDQYRLEHTFRYWLVNKYIVSRDNQSQRVFITSPSLNTSLLNLLALKQSQFLTTILQLCNITIPQYNALATSVQRALAVVTDMYDYEQTQFLNYFAVPWTQYQLAFYAVLSNTFFLRDGQNVTGVASNDEQAIEQGIVSYSNQSQYLTYQEPPKWWPNISNVANTAFMTNLSTGTSSFEYVYNMSQSNILSNTLLIDPNNSNYLYINPLTNSANAVCPINPAQYTTFKFASPVRQTLQVETLYRPLAYRLPLYNQSNFDSTINQYFDLSYNFVSSIDYANPRPATYSEIYDNLPTSNLFQVPGWAASNAVEAPGPNYSWLRSLASSQTFYTSNVLLDITMPNRAAYFQFTTPFVSSAAATSSYTYQMNLNLRFLRSTTSGQTVSTITATRLLLYHDRGAFEGDVLSNRNENPRFFKFSTLIQPGSTGSNIVFRTYENQTYYAIVRPDDTNFGTMYLRLLPFISTANLRLSNQSLSVQGINPATDPLQPNFNTVLQQNNNYAQVYDSNFIRLPIQSNLALPNPTADPYNDYLQLSLVPIGYDDNDVSTDYTSYVPYGFNNPDESYIPTSNLAFDPINQFEFQSNSPYNSTTQTFLYFGGSNSIFYPTLSNTYIPGTVENRQFNLVHYYSPNYIPESELQPPLTGLITNISTTQLPYTSSTTAGKIGGYEYAGTSCNIQLGRGVMGFSIIPSQGVWDLKRVVFRSAIYDSNTDPNSNIAFLGVFNMGVLIDRPSEEVQLSNALYKLNITSRVSYNSTIDLDSQGFDVKGGTYYEFQTDTSFVANQSSLLLGYFQSPQEMINIPEGMYTAIAFDSNQTPISIKALSGSAIPYPFYNTPTISSIYLNGKRAYDSTFQVVYPSSIGQSIFPTVSSLSTSFGPPSGVDQTQSQYALSQPIGTTVLNWKDPYPLSTNTSFFQPWTTNAAPTQLFATVPGYMMVQDTNYIIYDYVPNSRTRNFSNSQWSLTADQIFPSYETTSLIAAAGNSTHYYFLGFSNYNNVSNVLRLKRFNPVTGSLIDYNLDSSFIIPIGGTLSLFTINDYEQLVLGYNVPATTSTRIYYNELASTNLTSYTDTAGTQIKGSLPPTSSNFYYLPAGSNTIVNVLTLQTGATPTSFTPTYSNSSYTWDSIAVSESNTLPESKDRVYLNSQGLFPSSVLYSVHDLSISTLQVIPSSNTGSITSLANGANGGIWFLQNNSPVIWGNRNTPVDQFGTVNSAWQIFYPFQKVVLEKLANTYNAITDLTYVNYPEYPHTNMFYYSNVANYQADTSNRWGLESSNNFQASDVNLSGFGFNSYIFNVPLRQSSNANDLQVLTVRGYTPTERSETLIRFQLPNKYDFGYINSLQLIQEISTLNQTPFLYNQAYAYALSTFDQQFDIPVRFWGANLVPNFDGSNFSSSNFASFAYNLSSIYQGYQSNANLLSAITGYVNSNTAYFISTQLEYILPPSAALRQNFTDPLTFSIKWLSGLLPQYAPLLDDWGLGYNLGYAKFDTPYSTYHQAQSFYKILEDYVYLRLNPEYQMNRLDTTAKENFKITRDSTGQVNNYHGKLLLSDFNTYSRSFVSNQVTFNPPIGRLDQMYFQWLDNAGVQIDNLDCEWSASLTVTENKQVATTGSTIPRLPPMNFPRK